MCVWIRNDIWELICSETVRNCLIIVSVVIHTLKIFRLRWAGFSWVLVNVFIIRGFENSKCFYNQRFFIFFEILQIVGVCCKSWSGIRAPLPISPKLILIQEILTGSHEKTKGERRDDTFIVLFHPTLFPDKFKRLSRQ